MKILAINAGSTSVKFKLYDMPDGTILAEGNCQRVGLRDSEIRYTKAGAGKFRYTEDLNSHNDAFRRIMSLMTAGETAVLLRPGEINAVTHRVSMGGPHYKSTVFVTDEVLAAVDEVSSIAPLHNPPQAAAVRACKDVFGDIPMTIGFDTAFHQSMPEHSYRYAIPKEYLDKYQVRRYGFHGLSYQFVTERYAAISGRKYADHSMAVCHLGGGASITAVRNGRSMDNSFGIGTGQGLPCGTRAGDFDHVAIGYIMEKTCMTYHQVEEMLHKQSGLLGLSGISSDEMELEDKMANGDKDAIFALEYFTNQIKKYIGAYAFEMGGLDAIVFTGGIGENSHLIRAMVCDGLEPFGIVLDTGMNVSLNRTEAMISAIDSKVEIWIIPTNEELVLAQDTHRLLEQAGGK